MEFVRSREMKVKVSEEQKQFISSEEKIRNACKDDNVIAFDIYHEDELIGFAMLREYEPNCYFLWDYAIDSRYQNRHLGTKALNELIDLMKREYGLREMTTTYIWGNDQAKHLYEKNGFTETDVVDEPDCHEVNMIYRV